MTARRDFVPIAAVIVLFFLLRLLELVVREPFFDELFTVWMARKPPGEILPALRLDSGPPLYYFLARVPDVFALRVLSLVFATAAFALVLMRQSLGNARFFAAALLAAYPPAALYAVEGRAYALCGLFVAIAAIAIHEEKPFAAAGAVLLAAYTHWYGALFFPVLVFARPRRRAFVAAAIGGVLFLPGLWLATRQPAAALAWLGERNPLDALLTLSFVRDPFAIFVIAAIASLFAYARSFRFAPMVLVPLLLAIVIAVVGRTVYVRMRFESVLAVPLVLWMASSLERWPRRAGLAIAAALIVCGSAATLLDVRDHQRRPPDPFTEAARVLRENAPAGEPVLASGYLYLHAIHELGEKRVRAYPAEQGRHPGWRVASRSVEPLPPGSFLWIGERQAPELVALRSRPSRILFANDAAMILSVR